VNNTYFVWDTPLEAKNDYMF